MKAVVKVKPKPGVEIREVKKPEPETNEVLVEVQAAGICGSDLHIDEWTGWGYEWLHLPLVLGHEFSGSIVEVGDDVESLQIGDRVTATPHIYCGKCYYCQSGLFNLCEKGALKIGFTRDGAFAEYISVPAESVYKLPENLSFEVAALTEPLCVALHATEIAKVESADNVAVLGPGPIGLLTLQATRIAGAARVIITGIGADRDRLALAKKLGADITVNVEEEDPVAEAKKITDGLGVDVVFEASGIPAAFKQGLQMVRKDGKIVLIGLSERLMEAPISNVVRRQVIIRGSFNYIPRTWRKAIALHSTKQLNLEPLITHKIPLQNIENGFQLARAKKAIKVIVLP